jgi:membrane protease subunit HflC
MQGERFLNENHVPKLTVRANDGSNFFFEELTILYQIIPGDAAKILEDSGSGDGFKMNWIKAYARSVLRDEFGRFSAVDAADPTQFKAATSASHIRLNELLSPHGLEVTKVITPKPKFDAKYERAIEDRKEADQEVERLRAREEQLVEEKKKSLAAVLKEKEIEKTSLVGELRRELLTAEQESIRVSRGADAFAIEKKLDGQGFLAERIAEARGLEAKYTKEAEGLASRVKALEDRGQVVVRETLIQKLGQITFNFLPYSRDPQPKRLEHVQTDSDLGRLVDEEILSEGN